MALYGTKSARGDCTDQWCLISVKYAQERAGKSSAAQHCEAALTINNTVTYG